MQATTLSIAIIASTIVVFVRPLYGLIVYSAAMVLYPQYLTFPVFTVNFTICRLVIIVLLAKVFLGTDISRHFKFILLDKLVILFFACVIIAGAVTTRTLGDFLVNQAGAVFDMLLPYFAVRMIVRNRNHYLTLLKWILIIAAPLAIVGLYQCFTGNNPVGFMRQYSTWLPGFDYQPLARKGLYRANVTFSVSILYGLFFAMFGPVCAGLLYIQTRRKAFYWIGLMLMGAGIFASMSSGPMMAGMLSVLFIIFYRWRRYYKSVLVMIIVMCLSVEIVSNRHFYDVLGSLTLDPRTAWYRSKLIDVAIFEGGMSGHWLVGFGNDVEPGWCARIDGRQHTDIVNQYILVLSRYGLLGLIPFLALNVEAVRRMIVAYKAGEMGRDKWLVWCLAAAILGLYGAFMTVSLFDQVPTIFFMLLGFAGVMPTLVITETEHAIGSARRSRYMIEPKETLLTHDIYSRLYTI